MSDNYLNKQCQGCEKNIRTIIEDEEYTKNWPLEEYLDKAQDYYEFGYHTEYGWFHSSLCLNRFKGE